MARRPRQPADDYDNPWKEVIERFYPAFMEFFFPHAHADIDWSRGYEFLDKELMKVIRDARSRKRHVDKLVKVWRKSGEDAWVLTHLEVQGQGEAEFPERMYIYNYRLYDRYRRPVVSFAVLADPDPAWRPDRFEYDLWGCRPSLIFPVVKLTDFVSRWAELESSRNPFVSVVMAHLKTQETQRAPEDRLAWKLRIVRRLYDCGYSRQDVLELFRVIDWMMQLPEGLDRAFHHSLQQYEEERAMPYITSIERIGIEKGRREGHQEGREEGREEGEILGLRKAVSGALLVKFQRVPEDVQAALEAISDAGMLVGLVSAVIQSQTLEEFQQHLPFQGNS